MDLYREAYATVLKKNWMLLMMAIVLIVLTFGYWIGIPLFVVGSTLEALHIPYFLLMVCVFLCSGLFVSLCRLSY